MEVELLDPAQARTSFSKQPGPLRSSSAVNGGGSVWLILVVEAEDEAVAVDFQLGGNSAQ